MSYYTMLSKYEKQAENRLFLQIKLRRILENFVGVFNKTIIPLALVRYEIIKANEAHRALLE